MNDAELQALLEKAAEKGAANALNRVGLGDDDAGKDVADLRDLLTSWRDVKKTVLRTFIKNVTTFLLGAAALGAWMKWGGH